MMMVMAFKPPFSVQSSKIFWFGQKWAGGVGSALGAM
ncbi:hypothetical protein CHY_2530 [Carboxydothermus hydrogenoformans Z-2901]|uniref:Uncharacterized protein n=1 Tax=Carboxydothermus hydrogenoformans (strain ATCC BAA-161 / DSM 6008 / Z-2901) TaxID=246194 RepID=Q3A961_CARHZ|nr:hypothetical protein CHY_2530 [Carboxydothermus hydrogenoformans Z-2901]